MKKEDIIKLQLELDNLRLKKGISQEEFAAKIGISRQAYSAYINNESIMKLEVFFKICKYFKIDFNKLIYGIPPEKQILPYRLLAHYKLKCKDCEVKDKVNKELMRTIETLNSCLESNTKKKSSRNVGR